MSIRTSTLLAVLGSTLAAAVLLGTSIAQEKNSGDQKPTAAQKYKNIKVLKNVPADQIIPIMHKINDSLGVRCDHCHIVETNAQGQHVGWEKDDKPTKEVARKMMVMTNDLIAHQRVLDKKATCYMCHHGHAQPETIPPAPQR